MGKNTIAAKVSEPVEEDLEQYADENGLTKSAAVNQLLDQSLDIENGDATVVVTDGSGVDDKINQQEEILSEINQQVESVIKRDKISNGLLTAGLAYIITILLIEIPTELGLALGVPLIIALVWANFVR
jgi:hypothetical protein